MQNKRKQPYSLDQRFSHWRSYGRGDLWTVPDGVIEMAREYVPDMYDAFCWHEAEQERELAKRQRCDCCDQVITDDYCYNINGDHICSDCLEREYLVVTPVEK